MEKILSVPLTYIPRGLTKEDKKKQKQYIRKSRKAYKEGKYVSRPKIKSFKSKESPHIVKARKIYKINSIKPSNQLAKKTKCSIKGLRKIVKKGQGAYYSSGSRPSQTGHSWGIARLASSITGGNASKIDYHILMEHCDKNSLAIKMSQKNFPVVREKVKLYGGGSVLPSYIKNPKYPSRNKNTGDLKFSKLNGRFNEDILNNFTPNLTPEEILKMGSFGGTYFRPIYSSVVKKELKNQHSEFKSLGWFKNLDIEKYVTCPWNKYNKSINKYGVKAGTTLEAWENSGWINENDPYGWFQWYCRFYCGRRCDDDERQITRWIKYASKSGGRWRIRLLNMCKQKDDIEDYKISPVIRQGLQHWAFVLKKHHFEK